MKRIRQLGRTAWWSAPDAATVPQVRIGDVVYEGTALSVTRYSTNGNREVVLLTLVDPVDTLEP